MSHNGNNARRKNGAASKPAAPSKAAVVCYFDTPGGVYHACESLRDAGYKRFDAHTPFPVHGLEKAMGIPPSKLPWIVLACAFAGLATAFGMQYWIQVIDYPLNISGKPTFSYQAWVPICFELTILFSAFGCFFGMWTMNRLPQFYHYVMKHPSFQRATDDKFFISVETTDSRFDDKNTRALLEKLGAHEIAEVEP
jgi:hypothetical protein